MHWFSARHVSGADIANDSLIRRVPCCDEDRVFILENLSTISS
jgi:hypothetical protein